MGSTMHSTAFLLHFVAKCARNILQFKQLSLRVDLIQHDGIYAFRPIIFKKNLLILYPCNLI